MRRIRAVFAACVLPLVSAAVANCGNGEATTQVYPSQGGQAGSDASAAGGQAGSAGQSGMSGQAGVSGQAGAEQGGAAGQAGASAGAAGDAGSAGAVATGGAAGNASGGSAGNGPDGGTDVPCTSDAQCAAGTSCQVAPNASNTALELRCLPLAGANGNGYPCTGGSECRAGLCLAGYCSNPCSSDADCTQAGSCSDQTIQVGGLSGSFQVCLVAPCTSSSQCDPGEVCSDIKSSGNKIDAFCRQKQSAGAQMGAACQAAGDCVSQLCPARLLVCTEACGGDSDCAASAGAICVDAYNAGTDYVQTCAPGCTKASECPATKACAIVSDTAGDRTRFTCQVPWGTDATGADCSQQVNCASGLCLTNYLNGQKVDSICTQPCVTAADCPAGFTVCAEVQMPTPSGQGTQIIRACNH